MNPQSPDLFELLDSTHREVLLHLKKLQEVVQALEAGDLDPGQRKKAQEMLAFFNGEARQHHLDEEKQVFPALLKGEDAALADTARHLVQDHGWLEENWLEIEPSIDAAIHGNQWFDPNELRQAQEVFEALYLDHMRLEESIAYPAAQARLQTGDKAGDKAGTGAPDR